MIGGFKVSNISEIDFMDGLSFENFCAELLKRNDFLKVSVTKGSGDQGVDILASKDGVRYAIQCKNYSSHLGNTPIQEAYAGRAHYNCHIAVVMTNSIFTQSAKELAESTGVLLWDRETLSGMIDRANALDKKVCNEKKVITKANVSDKIIGSGQNLNAQKEKIKIKQFSVKVASKDRNIKSDSFKNKHEPKSNMRKSMKIWTWICFVFALIYTWITFILGELFCLAGAAFFGIFSVMFLLLGLTSKETPFLLNTKIKKSDFVIICIVVAFMLFGTIAVYTQNNL